MLPTDAPERPANVPPNAVFEYLGHVRGTPSDTAYGLESITPDNIRLWRRERGSWSSKGNYGSKAQAKRSIRNRWVALS